MSDPLRDVILGQLQDQGWCELQPESDKHGFAVYYDGFIDIDEICAAIRVALKLNPAGSATPPR